MRSLDELIDLDRKVVVVTGAGSGIGRGIALGLAGLEGDDLGMRVTEVVAGS